MASLTDYLNPLRWLQSSMLINGDVFYSYLRQRKAVYIGGRPGGFKTSLSVFLIWKLYRDNYIDRVYSNAPLVWADDIETLPDIDPPVGIRAALLLDEAGQFLERMKDVKGVFAAMRKMDIYIIMPSAEPPNLRYVRLFVFPAINLTVFGIPAIAYKVVLRSDLGRKHDKHTQFWWWYPPGIHGIYDSSSFPVDAGGIDHAIRILQDRFHKTVDANSRFAGLEAMTGRSLRRGLQSFSFMGDSDLEEDLDRLEDLSHQVNEAVRDMVDYEPPKPKKRRRRILGIF